MLWAGWVVDPHSGPVPWLPNPSGHYLCSSMAFLQVRLDRGSPTWGSESIHTSDSSFTLLRFLSHLEARVFATFWLDHPTAEGGAGSTEAPEAEADAEREKPISARHSEQAADAFPPTGSVYPLQPR